MITKKVIFFRISLNEVIVVNQRFRLKDLIMKIKALIFSICAIMSQSIFAKLPAKPAQCPNASVIKQTGLSMAERVLGQGYSVYHFSPYDTNNQWLFVIAIIDANNEVAALSQGNQVLKTLTGSPKPIPTDDQDAWQCTYQVQGQYVAEAFNFDVPSIKRKILSIIK